MVTQPNRRLRAGYGNESDRADSESVARIFTYKKFSKSKHFYRVVLANDLASSPGRIKNLITSVAFPELVATAPAQFEVGCGPIIRTQEEDCLSSANQCQSARKELRRVKRTKLKPSPSGSVQSCRPVSCQMSSEKGSRRVSPEKFRCISVKYIRSARGSAAR